MTSVRFNRAQADLYLEAVGKGSRHEVAAEYAGADPAAVMSWRERKDFGAEVRSARAGVQVRVSNAILGTIDDDRAAAQWLAGSLAADAELERLRDLTTDRRS